MDIPPIHPGYAGDITKRLAAHHSSAALREFPPGKDHMIAVRRILQWVNFVVCPYDGTNLKAVGRPSSLAVPLPMLCPTCDRRFELAGGNVIEQPPDETGDGSET